MSKIPSQEVNPKGLHRRYYIQKIKGTITHWDYFGNPYLEPLLEDVDSDSEYFVMRLDEGGRDPKHIAACRIAIHAYADAIESHLPELAKDLRTRYPKHF